MQTIKCREWKQFRDLLLGFATQDLDRRNQLIFRGHASSRWRLETTLDREQRFSEDEERDVYYTLLLDEFRREAVRFVPDPATLPIGDAFELLGRHHGLPSPFLDWTDSPYIAAFFAFDGADLKPRSHVAVWLFDRAAFDPGSSGVQLIDDRELLRYNRRALQQRGSFTRVLTVREPVEVLLGRALTKLEIPASERSTALADLDAMTINSASLFADLDYAARTAMQRMRASQGARI